MEKPENIGATMSTESLHTVVVDENHVKCFSDSLLCCAAWSEG